MTYDGRAEVLSGIDLVLEPGTLTALVGPSGSGKSTLASLLPRFWDVGQGRITIGGVDLREMAAADLYCAVSFVFQAVQLLRMSLTENIALARPDARQAEIEAAARAAQIHDRLIALPRGYASLPGGDTHLSGGEAQRVAIARAILADTPILVLDEATSALDPVNELAVQAGLRALTRNKTLIVVAHRLQTVRAADRIVVLDRGSVAEVGDHDSLLSACGRYAAFWTERQKASGWRLASEEVS
ncbi:MAG: ATP-binding cassette domain-containing protein [Pseudomonadota bacterium]